MAEILIIDPDSARAGSVAEYIRVHLEMDSSVFNDVDSAEGKICTPGKDFVAVVLNHEASPENYSPFPEIPTIVITNGVPTSGKEIAFAANVLDYIPDCQGYHLEYLL